MYLNSNTLLQVVNQVDGNIVIQVRLALTLYKVIEEAGDPIMDPDRLHRRDNGALREIAVGASHHMELSQWLQ